MSTETSNGECSAYPMPLHQKHSRNSTPVTANHVETSGSASAPSDRTAYSKMWEAGRYAELRQRLMADLIQSEASGDAKRTQALNNDLACVYRALGDSKTAAQFQNQAAAHEMALTEAGQLSATTISNMACDAFSAGNWRVAEGLLWKSLLAELAAGDNSSAAADWANLGLIANFQGDHEVCRDRLWEALKLHRRACDTLGIAMDLWHLGQSFEANSDWTMSRKIYQRAERLFTRIGHLTMQMDVRKRKEFAQTRERVLTFDVRRN